MQIMILKNIGSQTNATTFWAMMLVDEMITSVKCVNWFSAAIYGTSF